MIHASMRWSVARACQIDAPVSRNMDYVAQKEMRHDLEPSAL